MAYLIDDIGAPFLRAVRGLDDEAVIDSLVEETNAFPYFNPATKGGISIESAYFLNIFFPTLVRSKLARRLLQFSFHRLQSTGNSLNQRSINWLLFQHF